MIERANTRQEMIQLMDQIMNQTYSSLYELQELEPDTSLVKTYLIESHLPEDATLDKVQTNLDRLAATSLSKNQKLTVSESEDPTLFIITTYINGEPITVYIDISNPRFWLFHSSNRSINLDWLVEKLVKENHTLDRGWLWPELLERMAAKGSFRGLGLDFDRRFVPDKDFDTEDSVEYFKLQLWGLQARKVLDVLRKEFPEATTLAKVKIKFWLSAESEEDFSIDDIKFDGKITARGTSFQSHLGLVTSLYRDYSHTIRYLEKSFTLNWLIGESAAVLEGDAISLEFPQPISDINRFLEFVFSSSLPFRLWGVPTWLSDEFVRVSAVDLHAGTRLDFEITPYFIRLYLPVGSCGNSLVRFYTNLKHYYDSRIRFLNGDGESIL